MKSLFVLWDPGNPLVHAAPVMNALTGIPDLRVVTITFDEIGHPTLPNRACRLRTAIGQVEPDAILWIEGGPLPSDFSDFSCLKACWLLNTHLEPDLREDIGSSFDLVLSATLRDSAEERAQWLPLAASDGVGSIPEGVSVLVDDPVPPVHAAAEQALLDAAKDLAPVGTPVVVAMGNGGRIHPKLFDCLRAGAAVVVDPGCDLRGIAHASEHLEVYPSADTLGDFIQKLLKDPARLKRLSSRGPAIVSHLHDSKARALQLCRTLWPQHRILSGKDHRPSTSILVTCYRYLRRFRVCLESLARQSVPAGSLEIVVADPESPDGLAEELEAYAQAYPGIRVVHLPLDSRYHRNRGVGINRAFDVSLGGTIIAIDGDLVFPPDLVGLLEHRVRTSPNQVYGVRRSFVGREETERILKGELDPFTHFDRLSRSEGDGEEKQFVGVLGYCQAVDRAAFARARYPEEFDTVNQSDIVFVERLAREASVTPRFLGDQTVLHLWHPRNWMGTSESL